MQPKLSQPLIYERLSTVIDPELNVNIVKLGLIYSVSIDAAAGTIAVVMTLTTPGCPLAPVIDAKVREALFDLVHDPDNDIQLSLTFDPPWVPDMMDEEVRLELGL